MGSNWTNPIMWPGKNLDSIPGMNSESVDLIRPDAPYSSRFVVQRLGLTIRL